MSENKLHTAVMEDAHPKTINDLLAIIHRDGGHYVEEHGMQAAIDEACRIIPNERQFWDGISERSFRKGMVTGRNIANMERLGEQPIDGEVEQLIARVNRYSNALSLIRNGDPLPERIADEALYGEERAAQGFVRG